MGTYNYLKPAEVATIRRMTVESLALERHRMKHEGGDGPPFVKLNARVLYPADLLDVWLAERLHVASR
jgi:hypothetical protein